MSPWADALAVREAEAALVQEAMHAPVPVLGRVERPDVSALHGALVLRRLPVAPDVVEGHLQKGRAAACDK